MFCTHPYLPAPFYWQTNYTPGTRCRTDWGAAGHADHPPCCRTRCCPGSGGTWTGPSDGACWARTHAVRRVFPLPWGGWRREIWVKQQSVTQHCYTCVTGTMACPCKRCGCTLWQPPQCTPAPLPRTPACWWEGVTSGTDGSPPQPPPHCCVGWHGNAYSSGPGGCHGAHSSQLRSRWPQPSEHESYSSKKRRKWGRINLFPFLCLFLGHEQQNKGTNI